MKSLLILLCASVPLWLTPPASAADLPLQWQDNSGNEDGFILERQIGTGLWIRVATIPSIGPARALMGTRTYTDATAPVAVDLRYRMLAKNSTGETGYSNVLELRIDPADSLPALPSALGDARPSRLLNISARAEVLTGAGILIGGFVVGPGRGATVLIQGVGPALAAHGISAPLTDPRIEVIGVAGATNDNWSGADIVAAAAAVQAVVLPAGSKDAALLITLPPGVYTVHLTGVGATTGIALLEIYQLP
jgi:hypothetical protein